MFLHIGSENLVNFNDVVCIIDFKTSDSKLIKEIISSAEKKGKLICISDNYKSIVITKRNLYLTPISAETLKKRIDREQISEKGEIYGNGI